MIDVNIISAVSAKMQSNHFQWQRLIKIPVRSGIRTHAQRTGLRPERSALDRSAILTIGDKALKV